MSKAFTRESDDEEDDVEASRPLSALPPGAMNYMTPGGAAELRERVANWVNVDRPVLVAAGEARKVAALDRKIAAMEESLRSAVVVPPPSNDSPEREVVRLGAYVTVRRRGGEVEYRIVGVDEVDLDRGWVSCFSPVARALMNARCGEKVRFQFPSGAENLEIVRICYDPE